MNPEIEISAISVNKLKNETGKFQKYDMNVSLDEVENSDDSVKIKFKFTLLSNPTNIKINIDGFVSIHGNEAQISEHLTPGPKDIPIIVNTTYQEIFPLIYIISKDMKIPCPAYRLSEISSRKDVEPESIPTEVDVIDVATSTDSEQTEPSLQQNELEENIEESRLENPILEQNL